MVKLLKLFIIHISCIAFLTKLNPIAAYDHAAADNVNRELLQTIKSYMDLGTNPCDDFYQYVCGNWEVVHWKENKYVDVIGKLEHETNVELTQLLERIMLDGDKSRSNIIYHKLQEHYLACKATEDHDMEYYMDLLHPTGNETTWPYRLAERRLSWQGHGFNWMETLGKLRAYGLNNVLIKEQLRNENATRFIIEFNKPDVVALSAAEEAQFETLKESTLISERITATKLQHFVLKLQCLYQDCNDAKAPQQLTLAQLLQKVPLLDVRAYLAQLLQRSVSQDTLLLVSNVVYLRRLVDLLATTSKETIAHYVMLKLQSHLHTQLPVSNTPTHCMQHLRQHMQLALDYMYEREHYATHRRQQTDAIIQRVFANMQTKFLQIIGQHANELSSEELDFLAQKIQLMRLNIGNLPTGILDDYMDLYYADLQLQHQDFAVNFLNVMQHSQLRQHQMLQVQHVDSPELSYFNWRYASPVYVQSRNLLIVPFAYLRQPIFHHHYHELFIYAELGNMLGHELLHGFDTFGLQFDAWGNPSSVFAHAMTKPHFQESLRCLLTEFTTNINEKIADFGGFRLAYETYFERPVVPHFRQELLLSNKQLFFVKFAQFFCAVSPNRVQYDESHDTPFKRVPQVVANQQDFAKIFNCHAQTTLMNSTVKCNLW